MCGFLTGNSRAEIFSILHGYSNLGSGLINKKIGKPPALPGDSQSLTFPEIEEASFREPLKVHRKEAPDDG